MVNTSLKTDVWATGNAATWLSWRSVKEKSELECCQLSHKVGDCHVWMRQLWRWGLNFPDYCFVNTLLCLAPLSAYTFNFWTKELCRLVSCETALWGGEGPEGSRCRSLQQGWCSMAALPAQGTGLSSCHSTWASPSLKQMLKERLVLAIRNQLCPILSGTSH